MSRKIRSFRIKLREVPAEKFMFPVKLHQIPFILQFCAQNDGKFCLLIRALKRQQKLLEIVFLVSFPSYIDFG